MQNLYPVVCEPTEACLIASLHPAGSLFETPDSVEKAKEEHRRFRAILTALGCEVMDLKRDVLEKISKERLVELCMHGISYKWVEPTETSMPSEQALSLCGDEYKRRMLESKSAPELASFLMHRVEVRLSRSDINTPVVLHEVALQPLGNLIFTRDPLIVTDRGVVIGRMNSEQRAHEVGLVEACLRALNFKIVHTVAEPGRLEGGDFIPAGKSLAFIGCGLRTNYDAIRQLLQGDHMTYDRVAVVHDMTDRNQQRMHLDTVFAVMQEKTAILVDSISGVDKPHHRVVSEYVRRSRDVGQGTGRYELVRTDVEFYQYLMELGWRVILIPDAYQERYGINVLNVGNGRILTSHKETQEFLSNHEYMRGCTVEYVEYSAMNAMCGSLHCTTQVLYRVPSAQPPQLASRAVGSAVASEERRSVSAPTTLPPKLQQQCTDTVLMIAPTAMDFNVQAAADNHYMTNSNPMDSQGRNKLLDEYGAFVVEMRKHFDVRLLAHEKHHDAPDSVFPNNVFSTHVTSGASGTRVQIVQYPMKHPNRRNERENRPDVLECVKRAVVGSSGLSPSSVEVLPLYKTWEPQGHFLEGTGSLVLDRVNRVAYVLLSERSHAPVAEAWAKQLQYELVTFRAVDSHNRPVYHTNVVMSIGSKVTILCAEAIPDKTERATVVSRLRATGHAILELTRAQIDQFCANVLELRTKAEGKPALVMSNTAYRGYTDEQRSRLHSLYDTIIHPELSMLERIGGGSARCCLAEIFHA